MTIATPATRERLLAAAQDELIEGQGHLEMQAVARRAQASVGLAYHHFGSKAGLIAAVVEGFYELLDQAAFSGAKLPTASWAGREKARIGAYVAFHYRHPFAPLVIGPLSRAAEVLDVETAFTARQLAAGARMLEAAQRDGIVGTDIDPHLTIALMIGGIRQALIGALTGERRPDPADLTDDIWAFMAAALRLSAEASVKSKPTRRSRR
ncbi:TetR/AcrR family transcriptional regulator [Bradyrhizobium sp. Pear76]|uniref:TetR/AcrR family transcriptional regulator n=1 Tax=Bradyrhizobium oropedii TaxID=1571201 RepID=UPI001E62B584|nr:TetR/AcrR family transcriptional regulator [Bradyrhizobium oropedii]MCC8965852.1 TetR/AcrR family transcriptional regulator [Bradyrhizobium oropedii]